MKGTWIATHSPSKEYTANYDKIFRSKEKTTKQASKDKQKSK